MMPRIPVFRMKNGEIETKWKPRYVDTGKEPNYNSKYAQERINIELKNMKNDILKSEKGSRTQVGYGKDAQVIVNNSTFPSYMKESGINSTKDFLSVLNQKKGIRKERLVKVAIDRIESGYQDLHGYDMPDMEFKVKTGQKYDNKDIIFRRIRGRIVPLRISKNNRHDLMEDAPF